MYPYKIFGDFDLYTICITLGAMLAILLFRLLADRICLSARLTNLCLGAGFVGIALGFGSAILFQAFYNGLAGGGFTLDSTTGSTFYGGLIGGTLGFLLVYFLGGHFAFPNREHLAAFPAASSAAAAVIPLAHGLGRIGCFFAGCCHGITTGTPLDLYFPTIDASVLPTQLYEAAFLFALSTTLILRTLHGKQDGLPLYLIAYGTFRYFIEFLRGDDRGASPVPFLSPSQLTALVLVALGILLVYLLPRLARFAPALEVVEDDPSTADPTANDREKDA